VSAGVLDVQVYPVLVLLGQGTLPGIVRPGPSGHLAAPVRRRSHNNPHRRSVFRLCRTGWPASLQHLHRRSLNRGDPASGEIRSCQLAAGGPCDKAIFSLGEIFCLAVGFAAGRPV